MSKDLEIVKQKLKGFIRKYYKNQIIRGLLISATILLIELLTVDLIEYYFWSNSLTRTIIFYSFLSISGFVLINYIVIPVIKLFKIGTTLNNKEAAKIIGMHFPEVNDKLLNTLQLEEYLKRDNNNSEMDLLLASVNQKAAKLSPLPFKRAIDFKKNLVYLKYLIPPVLIILIVLIITPSFITDPSKRLINHSIEFEIP